MGDFEPRMDKWGEREVSGWFADLGDAIVNKGRTKRDRRRAKRAAERRARWKKSVLRRWLHRLLFLFVLFVAWVLIWTKLNHGVFILPATAQLSEFLSLCLLSDGLLIVYDCGRLL